MRDTLEHAAAILSSHEGEALFGAPEAVLKGLLEAETAVSLVASPRLGAFAALVRIGQSEAVADLLRRHEMRLAPTPTTARAITLAHLAARGGRAAVALVPNGTLAVSTPALARATAEVLPRGAALALLLEDAPLRSPEIGPIELARRLGLGLIAPADVGELRDAVETALRLSRAGHCPIGIMVHAGLLCSAQTMEARPNRVIESVDAMLARRRRGRRPRFTETADVLRMMRRLELNRAHGLPSPGERTAVGFVAVGPAARSLGHLVHVLRLVGRVPVLQLGAVHPIDDVVVGRLLARCERIVVLEPRPGAVEAAVVEVAEAMRRRGERAATVWGRALPGEGGEPGPDLGVEQALHPSTLARGIVPLLRVIRPTGQVDAQFSPAPPALDVEPPPRAMAVGALPAVAIVRRVAAEADQWLREQQDDEETAAAVPTVLEIDGSPPPEGAHRVVTVETWEPDRFLREGVGAIRQAALDDAPSIFVVCDVGSDGPDLARFAGGVIPAERADRVRIETANLAEPARLGEVIRAAALADGMTIVIVQDGPPPVCDTAALERSLGEIDRLGFEPRQRVTWPVDRACALRPPVEDDAAERRSEGDNPRLESEGRVDRLPRRRGTVIRFRARPLLEQVEVVRTRPPMRRSRRDPASKLPLPEIVHRQASHWRAHLAGIVSPGPGLATQVLARAGRRMGYAVSFRYDATPIGAGRRAWAQVLFTRPCEGETAPPLAIGIPFGGADLLFGLDATETLRAIASDPSLRVAAADRTYGVVNLGLFRDEAETEQARALRGGLRAVLRETTHAHPRVMDDFAGVCRRWFHTDRVVNVAMLGAAFQSGLVPVTVDAIEAAVTEAEASGYGRVMQAFQFGRRLAVDERLFGQPQDEGEEDVERTARRMVHEIARWRWRGRAQAARFARLVRRVLRDLPGLSETDPGRQAQRDIVLAAYRCLQWGGVEYAERYAALVTGLYRVDRGDTGRAVTRNAVLPLAAAMLIQDVFYVASMATSGEHRRRTRRLLNVKRARADELERRFLTRFELVALGRRWRFDLRTSDWPARAAAALRFLVPPAIRGTPRERDLRSYIIDLVERATRECPVTYEHFHTAMVRLHQEALEHRLRGMAISEIRMFAEPGTDRGAERPGEEAAAERADAI